MSFWVEKMKHEILVPSEVEILFLLMHVMINFGKDKKRLQRKAGINFGKAKLVKLLRIYKS